MAQTADSKGRPSDQAPSPEQVAKKLDQLEGRLAALRGAFDQYFLGLERHPPLPERDRLRKDIESTRGNTGRNTALKFRAASLFTRFLSYDHMWARTLTDIEEGRYHRDLFKARLHRQQRGKQPQASAPAEDVDMSDLTEPPQPERREAERGSSPGPSDDRLKTIYESYIAAKAKVGDSTSLTFEQLAQRLKKQVPAVLAKTGATSVDFKVLIKDGKATLQAVTRRPKPKPEP
jgi:hypothetical protein